MVSSNIKVFLRVRPSAKPSKAFQAKQDEGLIAFEMDKHTPALSLDHKPLNFTRISQFQWLRTFQSMLSSRARLRQGSGPPPGVRAAVRSGVGPMFSFGGGGTRTVPRSPGEGGKGSRTALQRELQSLRSEDEETPIPFIPGAVVPRVLAEDLDAVPALPEALSSLSGATGRKGKLYMLLIFFVLLTMLAMVAAKVAENFSSAFHSKPPSAGSVVQARAAWFMGGGEDAGLPPGYCTEHAMSTDYEAWAKGLVAQMTTEEKFRLIDARGYSGWTALEGYFVGSILAVPRLGIPSIKMQDAEAGFRTIDKRMIGTVTSWPCALVLSASWDPQLTWKWAEAMGQEFRAKGANVALGPAVNVHRVPFNGRNAEYISGEDPALGESLVPAYVKGLQEGAGVAAVVKHFTLNQQETLRTTVNSQADARVRWEQYYPPFEAAVNAGVAAVMCSYNYVNGLQACSNHEVITDDLKSRMGFEGWVMSDWWALTGPEAAAAGTDMDMPGNDDNFAKHKLDSLPAGRVEEMVMRTLIGMRRSGAWSEPPSFDCRVGCDCGDSLYSVNATSDEHVALARRIAAAGAVLLKNDPIPKKSDRVLPLKAGQKVAMLGAACDQSQDVDAMMKEWTAANYYVLGGSSRVLSPYTVSVVAGLKGRGLDLRTSAEDSLAAAKNSMVGSDVAVVCGGATAAETKDRTTLSLDQELFIQGVVNAGVELGIPVVVLAFAPGAVTTPWRDAATGVVTMFHSGQQTGHAAADILLGSVNPSGRLPVTFPAQEADATRPCESANCPYTEGLKGGWHMYQGLPVAYPFGFGLSYTEFEYTAGSMKTNSDANGRRGMSVNIRNVGARPGSDIVQLYVGFPVSATTQDEPAYRLRHFKKTKELQPGESEIIEFELSPRDETIWDSSLNMWDMVFGDYTVFVGSSSRDLHLCGSFGNQLGSDQTRWVPLGKCRLENGIAKPTGEEVFNVVAKPVIEDVLQGINGTIFAYGQTGSGKTFTITGGSERYADRGIIPRTIAYLFEEFQNRKDASYRLYISYLEIYNNDGYDLLCREDSAKKLEDLPKVQLREDEDGNIHLRNLSVNMAQKAEDALNLLFLGDTNRVVAETPMNDASTRSHCMFILWIDSTQTGSDT
ncbi:unnamed protein product, partial [Polarella glacialis]